MPARRIDVQLSDRRYSIHIERGARERVGAMVRQAIPDSGNRALLAVDSHIAGTHGAAVQRSLQAAGYEVVIHLLAAGETHKSLAAVNGMYHTMLGAGIERSSPVIAVGGGCIGDTAGFAAATFMRGLPLVHVPTTLLAMVDASIGGKTGVNLQAGPERRLREAGRAPARVDPTPLLVKNIVGAFWQPRAVIADPDVLGTLGPREFRCGLAECVKHAIIEGEELFGFIEREASKHQDIKASSGGDAAASNTLDALMPHASMPSLCELIARSAQVKVKIVEEDERESGRRALLNLGHTFAHAFESIPELELHHGEAVAIGLVAAGRLALETSKRHPPNVKTSKQMSARIEALLVKLELPTRLPVGAPLPRIIEAMSHDKKVRAGKLRFILPRALGQVEIVDDVALEDVDHTLRELTYGE